MILVWVRMMSCGWEGKSWLSMLNSCLLIQSRASCQPLVPPAAVPLPLQTHLHLRVDDEVEVPLPVPRLLVLQPEMRAGRHVQARRQHLGAGRVGGRTSE